MGKKHIITITGDHSSGQGTVSNVLKDYLGYEIYRNGQYVRKLALEKGMSIVEFQEYLNNHPDLDRQIEKSAKEYADSHDNLIVDAKLGWYAIPESFKVYLKVDIEIAIRRALNDEARKSTENYRDLEEAKKMILYRHKEETNRWIEEYGVNRDDMSNYDLVVDTSNMSPEEVGKLILDKYNKWLED